MAVHLSTDRPSVCPSVCPSACPLLFYRRLSITVLTTNCPSPFRPSTVRQSTDCLSPFHPPTTCLSVHPSVYSLSFFSQRPLTVRRRFDRQQPVYPPRRSICLSAVCLPSLVSPPTVSHRFDCQLSVCSPTVRRHFDRRLSVYPSTIRHRFNPRCLSIRRQPVCLSVHLHTRSCFSVNCLSSFRPPAASLSVSLSSLVFFSTSTDCPSPFRSPTVHLFVCLSVCLSTLVFLDIHRSPSRASARTATPTTRRGRLHAHRTGGLVLPSDESADIIFRPHSCRRTWTHLISYRIVYVEATLG